MYIHTSKDYTPNVLHFHGMNLQQLNGTFNIILEKHELKNDFDNHKLAIASTWTNIDQCSVFQQCNRYHIPIYNIVPRTYDTSEPWFMPNKIKFFIEFLNHCEQEIILFVDGYDVLFTHIDDILVRFYKQPYHILFGPSCNNYPNIEIDKIYGRQNKGMYAYFNAGCVIGYRKDLLKFYQESLQYIDCENPWNSEQFILRLAFSKYSKDKKQNFVGVDFESKIFQSMGMMNSSFNKNEVILEPKENELPKNILIIYNREQDKQELWESKLTNPINYFPLLDISITLLDYSIQKERFNKFVLDMNDNTNYQNIKEICEYCVLNEIPIIFFIKSMNVLKQDKKIEEICNTYKEHSKIIMEPTFKKMIDSLFIIENIKKEDN